MGQIAVLLGLAALGRTIAADGSVEPISGGVRVHTSGGDTVQVIFKTDRIVNVQAWPRVGKEPGDGYVVTLKSRFGGLRVDATGGGSVRVSSPILRATIDRGTGAVAFSDAHGATLVSELGRRFTPAKRQEDGFTVEQAFSCKPHESLFGLGQRQDGVWNLRGMPVDLRQHNTNVAIPEMVSTGGYGILWDNEARTQFNPVTTPIPLMPDNPVASQSAAGPASTQDLAGAKHQTSPPQVTRSGTFTTGPAGEYVFFMQNGNRQNEIGILVDGKPVFELQNMWTPYSAVGTTRLPANTTVRVTLRGCGNSATIGARLRETGQTVFESAAGDGVRYDFFYGPTLDGIISDYREATGDAPMLPLWAYGFWQCRERYGTQAEVLAAAHKYRQLNLPLDMIVQDWQYWGKYGWGSYQWDESRYPDPTAMIKELHDEHVKFMISVWPNPHGTAGDALKAIPHGEVGNTGYYDATNPAARKLRWDYLDKAFFGIGVDAWWQDAAEPGDDGNSVYGSNLFIGPGDRNALAYPLFHSETIYENQRATDPGKRVVNLTRSAYAGQQRYGTIVWSGDIRGDWVTFRRQIAGGLSYSLSGEPYWTTDSGGFFRPGNRYKDTDYNEVQARWFEWSTFCPIQRIHGYQTATEFWNWQPRTQQILADYDRLRYRMLPYDYSVAWQVTHDKGTIMRALAMDFPADAKAVANSEEYLFGPAFLVAPVTAPNIATWSVYLPKGAPWVNFWTGESSDGGNGVQVGAALDQLPLFVRTGSIVPFGPPLEYTSQKPADPIDLRLYPGADGDFTLYEDEGDSYRYEKGAYATIHFHWDNASRTLSVGDRKGSFPGMLERRRFRVIVVKPGKGTGTAFDGPADANLSYDGQAQTVTLK